MNRKHSANRKTGLSEERVLERVGRLFVGLVSVFAIGIKKNGRLNEPTVFSLINFSSTTVVADYFSAVTMLCEPK